MNTTQRRHCDTASYRPTLAQAALAATAFLAFAAALLLSVVRTHLGADPASDVLLIWTAALAFVGATSSSGLVWAATVSELDGKRDNTIRPSHSKPVAYSCPAAVELPHPASLGVLIDILESHVRHGVERATSVSQRRDMAFTAKA